MFVDSLLQLAAACGFALLLWPPLLNWGISLGLRVLPSQANFVTVDFNRDAKPVHQGLLERGVIVRPMGSYGMPTFLRVTVGTVAENDRFLAALKEALQG